MHLPAHDDFLPRLLTTLCCFLELLSVHAAVNNNLTKIYRDDITNGKTSLSAQDGVHSPVYTEPSWMFSSPGDVTIAALLPMFEMGPLQDCSVYNYKTSAWFVEPFLHVLRRHNFSLTAKVRQPGGWGNQTLVRRLKVGYVVFDHCWENVERAVAAALHLSGLAQAQLAQPKTVCENISSSSGSHSVRRVLAVVGPSVSDRLAATTAAIFSAHSMVQIATRTTHDEFSVFQRDGGEAMNAGYDYLFRAASSDRYQAYALAALLNHLNWTHFAVVAATDVSSSSVLTTLNEEVARYNLCAAFTAIFETRQDAERIDKLLRRHRRAKVVVLLAPHAKVKMLLDTIVAESQRLDEDVPRIWLGIDKWERALDAINEGTAYKRMTVQAMLATLPCPPSELSGYRATGATSLPLEASNYMRNLTVGDLRRNPHISGNPDLCKIFEMALGCSGVCTAMSAPGVAGCHDSDRLPDQLEQPAGQSLAEMIEPFTMLATETLMQALQKLFTKTVRRHPQLTGEALSWQFFSKVYGARLRQAVKHTKLACEKKSRCSVFKGEHELRPEYFIVASDSSSQQTRRIGSWKANSFDMSKAKKSLHLDMHSLTFSSRLFTNKDEPLLEGGTAYQVPSSICSSMCLPGHGRVRAAPPSPSCCSSCQKCGGREFSPGGTTPCLPCSRGFSPNKQHSKCTKLPIALGYPAGHWVILMASLLGITLVSATAFLFYLFRHLPVVRTSDRLLTGCLLVTMFLAFAGLNASLLSPTCGVCIARRLLMSIPLLLSMVIVLVKASRLVRVHFHSKTCQRVSHKWSFQAPAQILAVVCLLCLGAALEIASLIVNPPVPEDMIYFSRVYLLCSTSVAQTLTIDISLLPLIFVVTALAFLTRKLPKGYNEARQLFMASLQQCVIWGVIRSLYYLSAPPSQQLLSAFLVIGHMTVLWLWLFVPRMFVLLSCKPPLWLSSVQPRVHVNVRSSPLTSLESSLIDSLPEGAHDQRRCLLQAPQG